VSGIVLAAVAAIPCITVVIVLHMVLNFSKAMVDMNNGDTKCLHDVAVLLRAFRAGSAGLLGVLAKAFKRP